VPHARSIACRCETRFTCGYCLGRAADRCAADRNANPLPPGGLTLSAERARRAAEREAAEREANERDAL
jgi:hypothetical protein